ncbi:hypothetical protein BC829DRAFT_466130 [Chytridium lagenaria]|nr:hypothetical protein BC829DRAFT_466130 [Chytridium lagenaria]
MSVRKIKKLGGRQVLIRDEIVHMIGSHFSQTCPLVEVPEVNPDMATKGIPKRPNVMREETMNILMQRHLALKHHFRVEVQLVNLPRVPEDLTQRRMRLLETLIQSFGSLPRKRQQIGIKFVMIKRENWTDSTANRLTAFSGRNTLENHPELPEDLENEIQSHAELYRNNPPLSFDGMDPFLHPDEQLSRLKEKEKYLLIKRWEEIWDQVRPPVPKWHELRTKSFHAEAAKARKMSTSSDLQRISHQARLAILDLWRSQVTDKILFMSSMIPDEAKEDVFGDDLQRLRREALVVAMKNTFHARRPEIGKNARPEFAFSPWGGAAASKILGV